MACLLYTSIAVGRINTPQQAEEILEQDKADMVVMGRAQLADANFCVKAKEGRLQDIVYLSLIHIYMCIRDREIR